jgi:hypothetical protein
MHLTERNTRLILLFVVVFSVVFVFEALKATRHAVRVHSPFTSTAVSSNCYTVSAPCRFAPIA